MNKETCFICQRIITTGNMIYFNDEIFCCEECLIEYKDYLKDMGDLYESRLDN